MRNTRSKFQAFPISLSGTFAWLCGVNVQCHRHPAGNVKQLTEFPNSSLNTGRCPVETGDHLMFLYSQLIVHNVLMQMRKRKDGAKNHGLPFEGDETDHAYYKRIAQQIEKFAYALAQHPDIQYFLIQEGVVQPEHKIIFNRAIQTYLPGWQLTGGTDFGLWFIVRKDAVNVIKIDKKMTVMLSEKKLDSRLSTLIVSDTEKLSNIHVPHGEDDNVISKKYQEIMKIIIRDLIRHHNPTGSSRSLELEIKHWVSDREHMKDDGTRRVSVSGVTELTLRCKNKTVHHIVAGDFNLNLDQRCAVDQLVFETIKKEYQYQWAMRSIQSKIKYGVGLLVGGGITLFSDAISIDEAGLVATLLARIGTFTRLESAHQALQTAWVAPAREA